MSDWKVKEIAGVRVRAVHPGHVHIFGMGTTQDSAIPLDALIRLPETTSFERDVLDLVEGLFGNFTLPPSLNKALARLVRSRQPLDPIIELSEAWYEWRNGAVGVDRLDLAMAAFQASQRKAAE